MFYSKSASDDYDMPWEWKQKIQQQRMKIPKPTAQSQRPKSNVAVNEQETAPPSKLTGASDDYDEPWEKRQSYLLKTQAPTPSMKSRSPVPLPRQPHPSNNGVQLYEEPCDVMNQPNGQPPQAEGVYETPWDATGAGAANTRGNVSSRRFSQPSKQSSSPANLRKFSQPTVSAPSDNYDMPWEYKNKHSMMAMGPAKPIRLHEIAGAEEVDPNIPLDQQR